MGISTSSLEHLFTYTNDSDSKLEDIELLENAAQSLNKITALRDQKRLDIMNTARIKNLVIGAPSSNISGISPDIKFQYHITKLEL